ncbi:transposase family protein [Paenibacillus melissococcoides]|uniref:Transposase family protein n=1 Tax=Paenibacillus melissococcoides TaxID=2912268 RepID=A0ABM9FWB6_9BACL|nr:transposase family protein [Paenibacillus melissococcoides]
MDKPKHYFTLHFDALVITPAKDMLMNAVRRFVGEHDTRLWRILHHYDDKAIAIHSTHERIPQDFYFTKNSRYP